MLGLAALQLQQVQTQGHIQHPVSAAHVFLCKGGQDTNLSTQGDTRALAVSSFPEDKLKHPEIVAGG